VSLSRRSLITGLATLIAAPAIVKLENIMPVRPKKIISPIHIGVDYARPYNAEFQSIGRLHRYENGQLYVEFYDMPSNDDIIQHFNCRCTLLTTKENTYDPSQL